MIRRIETPLVVEDDRAECSEEVAAVTPKAQKIPVAYEEVALTEEAALIVEKARQAMAQQPTRETRPMQVGDPAKFRS
jgi:hypothetical protein